MQNVCGHLIVLLSVFISFPLFAESSCECPKLACDSCSFEKGITFFTDKCGPANAQVKSCARPTCLPIAEATADCPVPPRADSGAREPVVVSLIGGVKQEDVQGMDEKATVGRVKVLQGHVSITHADGKKTTVTKEAPLMEGDIVEAPKENGAVVNFNGGNRLHVHPDSTVEVKEFKNQQDPEHRKALLNLLKGKIRNQVEQKYKGDKTSYYRVMSKGAVAGVRGTDFLVEYTEAGARQTRVETLQGLVIFGDVDGEQVAALNKGEGAVFKQAVSQNSSDFVVKGKLSEVYKIAPEKMAELDRDSRMDVARVTRKAASVEQPICDKPKANLNQCMWRCEGNPNKAKSCRTDLPQVRCVRQRCNGNGVWAEETRIPAATTGTLCPAAGTLVKDCDY
jgi:hypothetical protein